MDTSTLDEKYDTFVERYSHKPSIDQFKRFSQIKYMDAKKYMISRKSDRKTSADLPIKSTPTLLRKSRTNRAHSSYNHVPKPPPPRSQKTATITPPPIHKNNKIPIKTTSMNSTNNRSISMDNTDNKYEECKEFEQIKTRKRSNEINLNISETMPIRLLNNEPSQRTRFLPLHEDNNDNNNIYINENYCNLHHSKKNGNGQDLRKYSGIDSSGSNGYYQDIPEDNDTCIRRDRRGIDYSNINNPYLDNKILESSQSILNPFKLFVAIDFGTDGVAIGYCLPNGNIYIHNNWKGENNAKDEKHIKMKSRILLDENGEYLSFGSAASYMYSNNNNNNENWMLFERFKMNLYSSNNKIKEYLTTTNGILFESKKVFIQVFKYIRQQVFYYLKHNNFYNIKSVCDIQWIITVPAIWDDIAKNKMREWAVESELCDENIPNHIKIVYEPDCASLCIQHKLSENLNNELLILNDENNNNICLNDIGSSVYILIDAGGGTVDISCHESMNNMKIKEIFHPSGGAWGSTYIDDEFIKLLNNIFSIEWINKFKICNSHSYYELLNNFRDSKHTFYNNKTHNVNLTYEFISFLEEECELYNLYLHDIINKCEYSNDMKLNGEILEISYSIWTTILFNKRVINPIIQHIHLLLNKMTIAKMRECKYMCLVGGLSNNKYFQYKLKQEFSDELIIIIPRNPIISVVEGAAMFGLYNKFVQARVLAKCYGTSVNSKNLTKSWMNKQMVLNLTNKEKQKHYNHKRECYSKIFKPIVYKNQIISIDGKPIIIQGARNTSNKIQKHTTVKIYQCDEYNNQSNTFFINTNNNNHNNNGNMKLMATACIVWPKDDKQRNKIILQLYFHDTIICGYVYAEKYPNDKKVLQLKYQFQ